jgi:hypothetical protein
MDHVPFVGVFQPSDHLFDNCQGFVSWHRPPLDALGQRYPFHQFQHQKRHALEGFQAVDRPDVRMIQRGQNLRLSLEARQTRRIALELTGQNLDGHLAPELGVGCTIDLAHAASTQRRDNFVRAQAEARRPAFPLSSGSH